MREIYPMRSTLRRTPFLQILMLVFALIVLFGAEPLVAQESWADKMFPVRKHDFGTVARATKAEFRFVFTNPYVETVQIASATSSCTCTSVFVEKATVPTYGEGAIIARFDTVGKTGPNAATITVVLSKPYRREVLLNVSGFVRADVTLSPKSVYFGIVPQGQGGTRTVDVTYAGGSMAWKIVGIECPRGDITARVIDSVPTPSTRQTRTRVAVSLSPNTPMGPFSEVLTLRTNDPSPSQSRLALLVEGTVQGSISVTPAVLFFGSVRRGESVTKSVVLRGSSPFVVESVSSNDPGITFDVPLLPAGEARSVWMVAAHLAVPPDATLGPQTASIAVRTSDPKWTPTFETRAVVLAPPTHVPQEE